MSVLGTANSVIVSKDDIILMGGAGEASAVSERVESLARQQDNTTSEYDSEKI